jgi:hypothetical protein
MNREIRFEVLRDSTKEIIGYERIGDRGQWEHIRPNRTKWLLGAITDGQEYSKFIRRQFTGLKDKGGKGNDVYEADIFEAVYKDCPDGFEIIGKKTTVIKIPAIVVYKWSGFYVEMMHPDYNKLDYAPLSNFLKNEKKL